VDKGNEVVEKACKFSFNIEEDEEMSRKIVYNPLTKRSYKVKENGQVVGLFPPIKQKEKSVWDIFEDKKV